MEEEQEKKEETAREVATIPDATNHSTALQSLSNVNLFDEKQLKQAELLITKLTRSKKGGLISVEDGIAVLVRAQDLNMPFSTAIEHIHVINGKTGIDIHIIKALLLKAGVTWENTKDYTPQYEYTDSFNVYNESMLPYNAVKCTNKKEAEDKASKDETQDNIYVYPVQFYSDFNGTIYREYQRTANFVVVVSRAQADAVAKNNKFPVYRVPNQPIDYVCEYKLTRTVNGKEVSAIGHFSYSEAVTAKMFDKDTYKYYARILIGHRAFTYAARDIASDVLLGCYETTELKLMSNVPLNNEDYVEASIID